jgi:hypothetical protein
MNDLSNSKDRKRTLAEYFLLSSLRASTTFFTIPISMPHAEDVMLVWIKLINQFENHPSIKFFMKNWNDSWKSAKPYDIYCKLFSLSHVGCKMFLDFMASTVMYCLKNEAFTNQFIRLLLCPPDTNRNNDTFKHFLPEFSKINELRTLAEFSKSIEKIIVEINVKIINPGDGDDPENDIMALTRSLVKWIE